VAEQTPLSEIHKERESKPSMNVWFWIMAITVVLIGFHLYDTYQEQVKLQEDEKAEGLECLYQFKVSECNPLNLTDKCEALLECIQ